VILEKSILTAEDMLITQLGLLSIQEILSSVKLEEYNNRLLTSLVELEAARLAVIPIREKPELQLDMERVKDYVTILTTALAKANEVKLIFNMWRGETVV